VCLEQGIQEDNANVQLLKLSIKNSLESHNYQTFSKLTAAAKAGDVDTLQDLIRTGADINSVDYDGRSAFAMVVLNSCRQYLCNLGFVWP